MRVFHNFSDFVAEIAGTHWAFISAVAMIVIWVIYGLIVGFSDTVQLVINTATTIITFLMVFAIQNTQNRADRATQIKLDLIIKQSESISNTFIGIEHQTASELKQLEEVVEKDIS